MATKAQAAGYGFSFELEGLKELDDMLRQLPKAMGKAVLRKVLNKAALPIQVAAKAHVPRSETRNIKGIAYSGGNLAESIVITPRLKKSQRRGQRLAKDEIVVYVGSTAPHAHLVEFGTAERYRKSGGHTGAMPAFPFLTVAWDSTKKKALRIIRDELETELVKAASRLRKKAVKGTIGKKAERELL